jgi:tetratricopeptide (TPR) repeat protein
MSGRRFLALLPCLLFANTVAAETPRELAKRHYDAGRRHFDVQEYAPALEDFKAAYEVQDYPDFLFNIAQCQRLLGQRDKAIVSYETYLSRAPEAENRAEIESLIAELKAQPTNVVIEAAAPLPPKRPIYKKWWLWTTLGVVAVGVGLGVGLGLGLHHDRGEPIGAPVNF